MITTKKKPDAAVRESFGKMVCFHPRYRLGIQHSYEEPRDFLVYLVARTMKPEAIVDYALSGRCEGLELQYSLIYEVWDIIVCDGDGDWDVADSFGEIQGNIPEVAEAVLCCMPLEALHALARRENALLPVILPDSADSPHLTTDLNPDLWSAGQIGWIYATRGAVNGKYHGTKELQDRLMKAEDVLKAEVEAVPNPRCKGRAIRTNVTNHPSEGS